MRRHVVLALALVVVASSCSGSTEPRSDVTAQATTAGVRVTNFTSLLIMYSVQSPDIFYFDHRASYLEIADPCQQACRTIVPVAKSAGTPLAAGEQVVVPWQSILGYEHTRRVYQLTWHQQSPGTGYGTVEIRVPLTVPLP